MTHERSVEGHLDGDGIDRISRYGWTVQDRPGRFAMVRKELLTVNDEYQRRLTESSWLKINKIASEWSWVGFGAVTVRRHGDVLEVVDGQHRVLAAMKRSDISTVPCMVFDIRSVMEAAQGFLTANTLRKTLSFRDRHKAMVVSGDQAAIDVGNTLARHGLRIGHDGGATDQIVCVGTCMAIAAKDPARFDRVIEIARRMSVAERVQIQNRLLQGLAYIDEYCGDGLLDHRLSQRLEKLGAVALDRAAARWAGIYGKAGGKVWAGGMIEAVNARLRDRFSLKFDVQEDA